MKTSHCRCGNRIFFNGRHCVRCEAHLGRCGGCGNLTSVTVDHDRQSCDVCKQPVFYCENRNLGACNCLVTRDKQMCRWCKFTTHIPNLEDPQNVQRWGLLETAKRRLLLQLESLTLPPFGSKSNVETPLSFRFLANSINVLGEKSTVLTGHSEGVITINLLEADSAYREKSRVEFGEPHRTLIGHMRHEIGHYFDWALGDRIDRNYYHELFGDPNSVDYELALADHYRDGPSPNWQEAFVSAYATMHPWEDFAETVNAYLDIMAIGATARDLGRLDIDIASIEEISPVIPAILEIATEVSEYNFDLGLLPLLPERLSPTVVEKLSFMHSLRSL